MREPAGRTRILCATPLQSCVLDCAAMQLPAILKLAETVLAEGRGGVTPTVTLPDGRLGLPALQLVLDPTRLKVTRCTLEQMAELLTS